ncbi:hypothetical protein [Streptomyces sp. NPDC047043]|uniref:hypothetical protein n=1 Tax=Streptomyces sp. NPDC047043 TaxID=3154497 RepID=UPI0033D40442
MATVLRTLDSIQCRLESLTMARARSACFEIFLDLRTLRASGAVTAEDVRTVSALGRGVSLHIIGAPAGIRPCLLPVPQVTLHCGMASAWEQWA